MFPHFRGRKEFTTGCGGRRCSPIFVDQDISSICGGRRYSLLGVNLGQHDDFGTVIHTRKGPPTKQQRNLTIYIYIYLRTQSRWFLKATLDGSEVRTY